MDITDKQTGDRERRGDEPVSGELLLAVIDRAESHRKVDRDIVPFAEIVAQLGVRRTARTTQRLRAQLEALVAKGLLAKRRVSQFDGWAMTDAGRAQLDAALQTGVVGSLPESPQHRAWREALTAAAEHIEPLRASTQAGAEELLGLLGAPGRVRSDAWLLVAAHLGEACRKLGLATYCLYEWAEPDDAHADIDDYHDPGDEQLDADIRRRLRVLRAYRRNPANFKRNVTGSQDTSPGR